MQDAAINNGRVDPGHGMSPRYVVTKTVPADDQTETIAFLSDPSTFRVDKVGRVDTHISCVFLAGDRAYKLKRAVQFSYLDFSTADLRRAACESELRLNRRTAPDIYLCVEAIRRNKDGKLRFGGEGKLVDFVVVMRRFDESSVLDNIARHGSLTGEMIRDLADAIAAFHEFGGTGCILRIARMARRRDHE